MPLFLTILFLIRRIVFLLRPVMQLFQNQLQLSRDRQSQICRILDQAQSLIGQIKENDRRPQNAPGSDHLRIQQMPDADQGKNENLAALCELYIYANK